MQIPYVSCIHTLTLHDFSVLNSLQTLCQLWDFKIIITLPRYGSAVLRSVCVSVCLQAYLWNRWTDLHKILCADHCGRGSVLPWWRCDTLCTSGFMDDVTFGHNGPYGNACLPLAELWYRGRVWCLWMPCLLMFSLLFVVYEGVTNVISDDIVYPSTATDENSGLWLLRFCTHRE